MAARKDYVSKKENTSAGGIGESKVFGGSYMADRSQELPDGLKWDELHVAGTIMSELPEAMQAKLFFAQTDEGIAWWNKNRHRLENREDSAASPETRGFRLPTGGDATDPAEKAIIEYRDNQIRADATQGLNRNKDPFQKLMDKHVPPGFKGLMMSKRKMDEEGTSRGLLDYQIVHDKDGKPVGTGNMVLGIVPIDLAREAAAEYRTQAQDQMVSAVDTMREKQEEVISNSKVERSARKHGMSDAVSGITHEDGDNVNSQVMGEFGREFA